jgi:hypothetical protein
MLRSMMERRSSRQFSSEPLQDRSRLEVQVDAGDQRLEVLPRFFADPCGCSGTRAAGQAACRVPSASPRRRVPAAPSRAHFERLRATVRLQPASKIQHLQHGQGGSHPLLPALPPARASACSMVSVVSTPKAYGNTGRSGQRGQPIGRLHRRRSRSAVCRRGRRTRARSRLHPRSSNEVPCREGQFPGARHPHDIDTRFGHTVIEQTAARPPAAVP